MRLVDQLPCGSGLTPAIYCTRFKIHSAHAESPMAKTFFFTSLTFQVDLFLLHRLKKLRNRMCLVDQLPPRSLLTPATYCTKFKNHSPHAESPMAKTFFYFYNVLGRTSLCFTDQETQEENVAGGPTPLWIRSYTGYLLYKVQDPISACRQSSGQDRFSSFPFQGGPALLYRPRNSGRECAQWTNSLVGQSLHQLSLVQSLRSIQRMRKVPWTKQCFLLL